MNNKMVHIERYALQDQCSNFLNKYSKNLVDNHIGNVLILKVMHVIMQTFAVNESALHRCKDTRSKLKVTVNN